MSTEGGRNRTTFVDEMRRLNAAAYANFRRLAEETGISNGHKVNHRFLPGVFEILGLTEYGWFKAKRNSPPHDSHTFHPKDVTAISGD